MAAEDLQRRDTELALAAKSESARRLWICSSPPMARRPAIWPLNFFLWEAFTWAEASAPRIIEKIKDGRFMKAFTDKGRLSQLLVNMPVRIILDSRAALLGAAAYAEGRAAEISGISRAPPLSSLTREFPANTEGQPKSAGLLLT